MRRSMSRNETEESLSVTAHLKLCKPYREAAGGLESEFLSVSMCKHLTVLEEREEISRLHITVLSFWSMSEIIPPAFNILYHLWFFIYYT